MVGMEQIFGIDAEGHVTVKVRHKDGSEEVLYDGKNDIESMFREYLAGSLASFPYSYTVSGTTYYDWFAMDYSSLKIILEFTDIGPKSIGPFTITPSISGNKITLSTGDRSYTVPSGSGQVTLNRVELNFKAKYVESTSSSTDPDSETATEQYAPLASKDITSRTLADGDEVIVNWTVEITVTGADVNTLNDIWTSYSFMDDWKIELDDGSGNWPYEASVSRQGTNSATSNYSVEWKGTYEADGSVSLTDIRLRVTYDNGSNWKTIMSRSIGSLDMQANDSLTAQFTFEA